MQIIPVIDLKDGLAVHAVRGDRSRYQPIHTISRLTGASEINAVIQGFLKLYPFQTFYIADLNAITGSGSQQQAILPVLAEYPEIAFWIDSGLTLAELSLNGRPANYKPVIGTESQIVLPYAEIGRHGRDFILSLDFKDQQPLGHSAWFADAGLWPRRVIVMTLAGSAVLPAPISANSAR